MPRLSLAAAATGVFLNPPPSLALGSVVRKFTLFVLSPHFGMRIAMWHHNVHTYPSANKKGAGIGCIVTKWLETHMYKLLPDGTKLMTFSIVATDLV